MNKPSPIGSLYHVSPRQTGGAAEPFASPLPIGVGHSLPINDPSSLTGGAGAPIAPTYSPCGECEGAGFFVGCARHPDDPRCEAMWDCDDCNGTGEVEPTCQCGSLAVNGFCADCDDVAETGWMLAERSALLMPGVAR